MVLSTHGQPQRSGKPVWMLGTILIIISFGVHFIKPGVVVGCVFRSICLLPELCPCLIHWVHFTLQHMILLK